MFKRIKNYMKKTTKKFNLTQYTKRFMTCVTIFTMLVITACIVRNTSKAYSLAITATNNLWKIGGLYMAKSLIETSLEKGSIGNKNTVESDEEVSG